MDEQKLYQIALILSGQKHFSSTTGIMSIQNSQSFDYWFKHTSGFATTHVVVYVRHPITC